MAHWLKSAQPGRAQTLRCWRSVWSESIGLREHAGSLSVMRLAASGSGSSSACLSLGSSWQRRNGSVIRAYFLQDEPPHRLDDPDRQPVFFVAHGLALELFRRIRCRLDSGSPAWIFGFFGFLTLLLAYRRLDVLASFCLARGLTYRFWRTIRRHELRFRAIALRTSSAFLLIVLGISSVSFYLNVVGPRWLRAAPIRPGSGTANVLLIVLDTVRFDRLSSFAVP